jgi:NADH-quinone oxidoreductase subunit M
LLTVLLLAPFFGAVAIAVIGVTRLAAVAIALTTSLITLALAISVWLSYQGQLLGQSLDVNAPWVSALHINFHLSVDGMGALFLLLTAIVTPIAVIMAADMPPQRIQSYLALLLFLEGALVGVFTAVDLVLFYFFWEAVLIPIYFMIGVYGGERRIYAAFKYVLYTMTGSLLMLVGIVALYALSGANSFDLLTLSSTLQSHALTPDVQRPLFLAFAVAFAIKSAVFPFHSWVPDVYVESNMPTAIILSGVVSKMGIYGFLRVCLPLFPAAARYFAPGIMVLAVIGIIYGALLALNQWDIKRLVACSSIAHLGFIALGIFSLTLQGIQGASLQAVNHGITIAALFVLVAVIAARWDTTDLRQLGGLASKTPVLAAIFLVVTLSALGLPGLNGFAGEFLILLGTFQTNAADAVVGTIGVVLAAAYMLRLFQGVEHGPLGPAAAVGPEAPGASLAYWWSQLSIGEYAMLIPLIVLMVWIGVAPGGWLGPTLHYAQNVISLTGGQP